MRTGNYRVPTRIIFIIFVVCTLALVVGPLLVQAGPELPPRDPPATHESDDDDDGNTLIGAYILLQTQPAQPGVWATVQWQDSTGDWQNVEGWHGTLDPDGHRLWWVDAKDFGKGPFRWVVTQGPGGPVEGTSTSFHLPSVANEIVRVTVPPGS